MFICVFVLLILVTFGCTTEELNPEYDLTMEIEQFILTGKNASHLRHHIEKMGLNIKPTANWIYDKIKCRACSAFGAAIIHLRRWGTHKSKLKKAAKKLCHWFQISSEFVCDDLIDINADTFFYIIDHGVPKVYGHWACSFLFQHLGCTDWMRKDWNVLLPPKNKALKQQRISEETLSSARPMKILQITDVHYQPSYKIGSNAKCHEPLCCRNDTHTTNKKHRAGPWGDYHKCDTPAHVFISTLKHITSNHRGLSYFYFTGDIIDHSVWNTTVDTNKKIIGTFYKELRLHLKIPGFPILGNYESHPSNVFSPPTVKEPSVSTQWLFNLVADKWKMWLPAYTRKTILKGGYYTVLVKRGFRIVALNSNVCYIYNWWLLYDDVDPYGQLRWLIRVLTRAEANNEKVHILSHIPIAADGSCFWNWGRELARIIERFSDTIAAEFNGHTHTQDIAILFKGDTLSEPIHVSFNGGSVTTYSDSNPNYLIYNIDPKTYRVLDFESWIYNVTKANLAPESKGPSWYKLYSFKEAFGLSDLNPKEISQLVTNMTKNRQLAKQYHRYRVRESDTMMSKTLTDKYLSDVICTLVTPYSGHSEQCDVVKSMWHQHN